MAEAEDPDAGVLTVLLENRRAFLGYLERRLGDRGLAEDSLQDSLLKVMARPEAAPPEERVGPWFYRTLRNAAIDQLRRRGAAGRALETFARELDVHTGGSSDAEICACVSRLARTLKKEYAEALEAIDVGGVPVGAFAERKGLSPGNAAVRVHRARAALKTRVLQSCGACAQHGCLNCTCRQTA